MVPVQAPHYLSAVKTTKIAQNSDKNAILRSWQPRALKLDTR